MKIGKKIRNVPENSITLEEMRLSVPEQHIYKAGIFYFALLMLGMGASLGCFYSSFPIPIAVAAIVFFTVLFGAAFTAIFLMKRKNTWFVVGAMGIITVIILIFRKSFYRGMLITVKYILEEFRSHGSGIAFPNNLKGEIKGTSEGADATFFIICLIYILSILISWLLIKRRNFFLAGFVTLPFVLAPLFVPITPAFVSVIFLLFYYFTLIFLSPSLSGSKMFRKGFRGYHISSSASANPVAFLILTLFLVCVLIVSIIFPQSSFRRSPFLEAIRTTIVNGFDSSDFSRYMNATFGGDLSDVDLKSVGNISFNNLPVLGLTMNGDYYYNNSPYEIGENHTEYLKGYVGSLYSEEGWKDLSDEQSQEVSNILGYSMNAQNIFADIKSNLRYDIESRDYFEMSVKYIRGDPRRVYIPYGLSEINNVSDIKYIDDGYVVASNSDMGIDEYNFSAFSVFDDNKNMSLSDRLLKFYEYTTGLRIDSYKEDFMEEHNFSDGYFGVDDEGYIYFITNDGDYYDKIDKYDPLKYYGNLFDKGDTVSYDDIYPLVSSYLTTKQLEYVDTLKKYEDFANENYTQLPESSHKKLREFINQNNIRTDTMDSTITDVINVLKNSGNYQYTLSPGRTPDGTDFAEYFLFENKKGYCRHFATAAALLLREAGIPARYAEGYKFESTQFINTNYIELLDSNAHAWVEVYYSGTGWVPIEVTPATVLGGQGTHIESSSENSQESSLESSKPSESSTSESSAVSDESELKSGGASDDKISNVESETGSNIAPIVYILLVPICCGLIYGVLALNRFIRVRKRRKGFNSSDKNKAALALYGYTVMLLLYQTASNDKDTEYDRIVKLAESERISLTHRTWCSHFCKIIYPIAEKAKFSGKNITDDELRILEDSAKEIRSSIMNELNFLQKFAAIYFDII